MDTVTFAKHIGIKTTVSDEEHDIHVIVNSTNNSWKNKQSANDKESTNENNAKSELRQILLKQSQ